MVANIYEDMVQILLILKVLFTQDSEVEYLFYGASLGSGYIEKHCKYSSSELLGINTRNIWYITVSIGHLLSIFK